jgi:transposase-like protein
MQMDAMNQWLEAARKLPGTGQGRHFPAAMRADAVRLAAGSVKAGARKVEVCRQLGISTKTMRDWEKRPVRLKRGALVPIRVVAEVPLPVRLYVGGGHADLTLNQLAELLGRVR